MASSLTPPLPNDIDAVRRFNREYTKRVGALRSGLLSTPYPLPQARILFELAQRDGVAASVLAEALDLDPSYLSRMLKALERAGLVLRARDRGDARRQSLALTAAGRAAFAELDRRSRDEVAALLGRLAEDDRRRLVRAMATVETLTATVPPPATISLRAHEPGDLGWVVSRHGALYAREHGWDITFEAFVADIAAAFLRQFEPARERAWIAERDGERVGSAFVVVNRDDDARGEAKLRMLLVEPSARGLGVGRRLVGEAIRYARAVGYREMVLWTNDILHAARELYVDAGFVLEREETHDSFGQRLTGQYWRLALSS
jgi:DNA-binding MarR family transcriptional regulator/GNAT superfamily N-acetyltransferase